MNFSSNMITLITEKLANQSLEEKSAQQKFSFKHSKESRFCLKESMTNMVIDSQQKPTNSSTFLRTPAEQNTDLIYPNMFPPSKRQCKRSVSIPSGEHHKSGWKPKPSEVWKRPNFLTATDSDLFKSVKILPDDTSFYHTSSSIPCMPKPSKIMRPLSADSFIQVSSHHTCVTPNLLSSSTLNCIKSPNDLHSLSSNGSFTTPIKKTPRSLSSTPLNTDNHPARSRSQPCELVKTGIKRRREEGRTLDFNKMTEHATRHRRRYRSDEGLYDLKIKSSQSLGNFFYDGSNLFGLNTIACSPAEAENLLVKSSTSAFSPKKAQEAGDYADIPFGSNQVPPGNHDRVENTDDDYENRFLDDENVGNSHMCLHKSESVFELELNSDLDIDTIENN